MCHVISEERDTYLSRKPRTGVRLDDDGDDAAPPPPPPSPRAMADEALGDRFWRVIDGST